MGVGPIRQLINELDRIEDEQRQNENRIKAVRLALLRLERAE